MTDRTAMVGLKVQGFDLPVYRSTGNVADGIAFGQMGAEVFITLTCNGEAFYVRLQGDQIDDVGGLMANVMVAATRAARTEPEVMQ